MYDAGTVFHSYPHYLMTLYRDSLPGATIHVENNYLGSWKADQKYLHLKSVDWDLALNPFMWGELVEFTGATAAAGLTTALLISAGASVCSTGIGCLAGGPLIVAGGGSGATATVLLARATIIRFGQIFDELTVWSP